MSVRTGSSVGAVNVPDTVDDLVTDPGLQAQCDQVRAALHRVTLPVHPGTVWSWGNSPECTTRDHCAASSGVRSRTSKTPDEALAVELRST